jgi:hypothetical protein
VKGRRREAMTRLPYYGDNLQGIGLELLTLISAVGSIRDSALAMSCGRSLSESELVSGV